MKKTYLIIGTSAAGLGAAIKLRNLDQTSTIICLTAEQEMPYNRCLLAEYVSGAKTASQIGTKPQAFLDEHNIQLMTNANVVAIDRINQHVHLIDGRSFAYDKLFIGTGRSGTILPIPGNNLAGVFSFYSLADTTAILQFVKDHQVTKVSIVGAGLSGLECADALASQKINVTIIERSAGPLPQQLDQAGSNFLLSLMQKYNITFYGNDQVEEILGNTTVRSIKLANGMVIPTNMVIFTVGNKINSRLAQACGLPLHKNGIVVNQHMQTNDPNIFAGGDVCVVNDLLTNQPIQSCLWADAAMQGMVAGCSMAGQERNYPGSLIVTSSHIFGTTFVTCGPIAQPPPHLQPIVKHGDDFYHTFLIENNALKGFAMIGRVDNVGMLRKKILDKTSFHLM